MALNATSGEKTAAVASAPAKAISTAGSSLLHAGVALETFSVAYNGQHIVFLKDAVTLVETPIKALVQASDKTVVWSS